MSQLRKHVYIHTKFKERVFYIFLILCCPQLEANPTVYTLTQVESLALINDPVIQLKQYSSDALAQAAIAAAELNDPRLTMGLFNLPSSDFDLNKNPTTQFRLGLKQVFPRGDTRHYQSLKQTDLSSAAMAKADLAKRAILRQVRLYYMAAFYQQKIAASLVNNRQLFAKLLSQAEQSYGLGRLNQQALIEAEIELAKLDERLNQSQNEAEISKALLAKWVPELMAGVLQKSLPALAPIQSKVELKQQLANHPLISIDNAQIKASQRNVAIAKEQYKPGFDVGLEYRKRFGDDINGDRRDDLIAATLSVELPLFSAKRQDSRVREAQFELKASKLLRDEHLRSLDQMLNRDFINWQSQAKLILIYRDRLLPGAISNEQAALVAYQQQQSSFSNLMKAYINKLELDIAFYEVQLKYANAAIELLYLSSYQTVLKEVSNNE